MSVFVATGGRLVRLKREGRSWSVVPVIDEMAVQCVAADGERVIAGTRGSGAMVSADSGATWAPVDLPEPDVFSVAVSPADGALYAGTEPSRLFVSRDGSGWEELEALQEIPSRERWSFPPRPWTHHVRWIAPDPQRAERLLVGIELGGLMYTDDGGASFTDHRPGAKLDAHFIAWHPSAEGRAYETGGDGAAWSADGGLSWEAADAGRSLGYCWALAVDPADPERWYISAASGPGATHSGASARGRLYRWEGTAWGELPTPPDSMPYALAAVDGELIAGMADGRLLSTRDEGESWEPLAEPLDPIGAMALAR